MSWSLWEESLRNLEGEEMGVELPGFRGGDRTDIELPAVQRELIAALHHAGKKVVLVNCSGFSYRLGAGKPGGVELSCRHGIPVRQAVTAVAVSLVR